MIGPHEMPEDHKERLVDFFWSNLSEWLEGRSVEMPDGTVVEPSFEVIRHAMWLCEGLNVPEVAEMFEAAIPADLRATCWDRIDEIRAEQFSTDGRGSVFGRC